MESIIGKFEQQLGALSGYLAFDPGLLAGPELVLRLVLLGLLLMASAFFSSSETALFSLSRIHLREIRRGGHPSADSIHALLDQPRRLIISILCGNEIINIAAAANMTAILLHLYSPEKVVVMNLLVMVPLLLLLGEVTPKTIAVTNPVMVATRVTAAPLSVWVRLVAPLRWLVRLASEKITTILVGPEKAPENILKVDEFRTLVEEVVESGELHAIERVLIDNLLEAGSTDVVEIMIPHTRVASIDGNLSVPEAAERVRCLRHRRVPVFGEHRDTLLGMLHAEDFMQLVLDGEDLGSLQLEGLLHEVAMVPPTKKVDELFNFFLEHRTHAAIVLNEFGGIDGMVTLRGAIGFIFGKAINGGPAEGGFQDLGKDVYEVDGAMPLDDFNELTSFELTDEHAATVGGVLLSHLDRLPRTGDRVALAGACLQILALEGHRVSRIRVSWAESPVAAPEAPPALADSADSSSQGPDEGGEDFP
jgi:CBS domain containing-hemolysin-like protein